MQRAVTPYWMGKSISGRFLRAEKTSEDINSRLFLMNKKGLTLLVMVFLNHPRTIKHSSTIRRTSLIRNVFFLQKGTNINNFKLSLIRKTSGCAINIFDWNSEETLRFFSG
jgi:hypothetical protein